MASKNRSYSGRQPMALGIAQNGASFSEFDRIVPGNSSYFKRVSAGVRSPGLKIHSLIRGGISLSLGSVGLGSIFSSPSAALIAVNPLLLLSGVVYAILVSAGALLIGTGILGIPLITPRSPAVFLETPEGARRQLKID